MTRIANFLDVDNPLCVDVPEFEYAEWRKLIGRDSRVNWPSPRGTVPESYIEEIESTILPTKTGVDVARALNTLLITSLRKRNPLDEQNRKDVMEFSSWRNKDPGESLRNVPWFPDGAKGTVIRGPTGCRKSHTVEAFCRQFTQVLQRPPMATCGWSSLQQVVYLRAFMPTDKSRSGLLLEIASQLDRALDTVYARELKGRMKLEQQIIYVLSLLMLHRVGILILEEAQEKAIGSEVVGLEFANLFLRIMNCGIPLVLVGNPLAFDNILTHTQDLRRLTDKGMFELTPAYNHRENEWALDFVPKIWEWTIFDKPDAWVPSPEVLYRRSGGIHGLLVTYRKECLIMALRMGADSVNKIHCEIAWNSVVMKEWHGITRALTTKDEAGLKLLGQHPDWPIVWLQDQWKRSLLMQPDLGLPANK